MVFFAFSLCTFYMAFAAESSLDFACKALYGVDVEAAKAIARNPQEYWEKRKAALTAEGATIPHVEFCYRYAKEALRTLTCLSWPLREERLASRRGRLIGSGMKWWVARFPEQIEVILRKNLSDESPMFPNALAYFCAKACDELWKEELSVFASKESFVEAIKELSSSLLCSDISHEFNQKLRWQVIEGGSFPIFDSLVMAGEDLYLCSVPPRKARKRFSAHDGEVVGWYGAFKHDTILHAFNQYRIAKGLESFSIKALDVFNSYCSPALLVRDDIVKLSQQVLACFYKNHELPATGAFAKHKLYSLLNPSYPALTDAGFVDIVKPFSMLEGACVVKDVHGNDLPMLSTHRVLMKWVDEYCLGPMTFFRNHPQPERPCLEEKKEEGQETLSFRYVDANGDLWQVKIYGSRHLIEKIPNVEWEKTRRTVKTVSWAFGGQNPNYAGVAQAAHKGSAKAQERQRGFSLKRWLFNCCG